MCIRDRYKTKPCRKGDNQCKFRTFLQKDVGEIVALCTGFHNPADHRRNPFADGKSARTVYIGKLCEEYSIQLNTCPHPDCGFCKNLFELYFHPDNFKNRKCPYYDAKKLCRLGAKCFRYHLPSERENWSHYWESLKAPKVETSGLTSYFDFSDMPSSCSSLDSNSSHQSSNNFDLSSCTHSPTTSFVSPKDVPQFFNNQAPPKEDNSRRRHNLDLLEQQRRPSTALFPEQSNIRSHHQVPRDVWLPDTAADQSGSFQKAILFLDKVLRIQSPEESHKYIHHMEQQVEAQMRALEAIRRGLQHYKLLLQYCLLYTSPSPRDQA
eukprot:TRINITY_DN3977_c0_g1_i2.p1 TRINITY_DN3977_c0_g1~~TRINITY_DN3977_c0_g1_i2.p1  ORF type:complete len:343 (+),score=53.52 TRINITY_DN3977_c0_g1_i2:61-1029(+)